MAKRGAKGAGNIRKRTITRNGKQYTYWEGRVTTGRDPTTGKQVQRYFSAKTQKEVLEKMQKVAVAVNDGTYTPPSKLTVGQWLTIWADNYLGGVKYNTVRIYKGNIKNHITPALGGVRLSDLHPHTVQVFINGLKGLSPQSVRMVHQVLHHALERAVMLGYIPKNPAAGCVLPRKAQKEIHPLDDEQAAALLDAARGGELEHMVTVALFTGLRISELLGLTWDAIDFERGTITVDKQLATFYAQKEAGPFTTPKSGKPRTIAPAVSVMAALRAQRRRQMEAQLRAGPAWSNPHGLVFTGENGGRVLQQTVDKHFRALTKAAGLEGVRFHDLRHTYAVNAIRAGDDIKTIQSNLGHATAAFTLDRYAHFTERMRQDSAQRMEGFIKEVMKL